MLRTCHAELANATAPATGAACASADRTPKPAHQAIDRTFVVLSEDGIVNVAEIPRRPGASRYSLKAASSFVANQLLTFAKLGLSAIDSAVADRCTVSMRVLTSSGVASSA